MAVSLILVINRFLYILNENVWPPQYQGTWCSPVPNVDLQPEKLH